MPPDVTPLAGGPEAVNEAKAKVKLDQTVPDLLAAARGEWFKLCLLCHVGGATGPVMPNGPVASDAARMIGIVQFWAQATEEVAGGGEAPAIPLWHGVSLDTIAPAVVQYQLMAIPKARVRHGLLARRGSQAESCVVLNRGHPPQPEL